MISCTHITKKYGVLTALNNVSLECPAGEVHGLVGVNGAGKSTLFKVLLGLVTPDDGTIRITANSKKKVGGIIEKPNLYPYLSAQENLRVFALMQNAPSDKLSIENSLLQVGLSVDRNDAVKNYSLGMKQRLGIAIALLNKPSCLLLDEPFSGLDPLGIESLKELIHTLATESNIAILIASHIIDVLNSICSKLHVISNGIIVRQDATASVILACTIGYAICGTDLDRSETLKEHLGNKIGDCITLSITAAELTEMLSKLAQEKALITSCKTVVDMQRLFNSSHV